MISASPSVCRSTHQRRTPSVDQQPVVKCLADPLILEKAGREERLIITCDLDFADLLALSARTLPSVILIRLQDQTPGSVIPRLVQVLSECHEALTNGAIVTIEETRYRLRRLPTEPSPH